MAVEFALVAPLLLLLVFGVITFGYGYFEQQGANAAAREGARLAAVGVTSCGTWPSPASSTWLGHVKGAATGVDNIQKPTLQINEMADSADPSTLGPGDEAVVTIPYTVPLGLLGIIPGFPASLSLTATAKARVEGVSAAGITSC
ncbi:MAG: pilus assembly protein [Actinomycetota bacterium]|nr:pilus assembly protein [Actinomycetota bacterium]